MDPFSTESLLTNCLNVVYLCTKSRAYVARTNLISIKLKLTLFYATNRSSVTRYYVFTYTQICFMPIGKRHICYIHISFHVLK
jgi:hypothetical protein